jgi:hypothetical protein
MSLLRKVTNFATSPSGRRAIREAQRRLDTPQNRSRVSSMLSRRRGGAPGPQGEARPR